MGIQRNPVTYEQCKELQEAGLLVSEIAKKLGCSEFLVYSRLDRKGEKLQRHICHADKEIRNPITAEEINGYRNNLKIGEKVKVTIRVMGENFCMQDETVNCVVTEKYRNNFLAIDEKGRKQSITYIDMLTENGGRT